MFKKVLIAEDMEDINKGVFSLLTELGVQEIDQVQYCDDAYLKVTRADIDGDPFDLVISDLSFQEDHRSQKYPSGQALVEKLKADFPKLKVIVYSVEDRLQAVRTLFIQQHIDAYVCKSRSGLKNLTLAITEVSNDGIFLSPEVSNAFSSENELEIDDYDISLLENLSKGLSQDEISALYRKENISPASLSSIEKRLNKLRIKFNANNAIHLVAIVKDLGLI
ncbi:response regulator [Maribacter ulvicola]|uniref:DNA-binding response regulator, NarL/FixJ family, contains REC and HTH domains n=1 Tax=Maribacter ulvicola TaxID=228959 RepID=A0A1N6WLL6_9FLAO|nr:response regulator [Maribacter ulvicola]SIQ90910.1 DNA-binding response regulator, NarL/FixJ family, contains REC and HTH domains [Maribacter ulvicola]